MELITVACLFTEVTKSWMLQIKYMLATINVMGSIKCLLVQYPVCKASKGQVNGRGNGSVLKVKPF